MPETIPPSTVSRNSGTAKNGHRNDTPGQDGGDGSPPSSLTLQQLQEAMSARGTVMGYSTLSEFIKTGDIAEILGAGGTGSRRAFDPSVADILAGFFTEFRAAGGKMPQAPTMLRSFLRRHDAGDAGEMIPVARETSLVSSFSETPKLLPDPALPAALESLADAVRSLTRPTLPSDRLLSAEEAAVRLACSPRAVSRYVKPVLPRKWRESDVQRFIAGLGIVSLGSTGNPSAALEQN